MLDEEETMLSKEEKKAIKECKRLSKEDYYGDSYFAEKHSIQILLNLLEKLQKENKKLNSLYKKEFATLNKIIKEKNKQIDLMADYILLFKTEKENPKKPDGCCAVKKVSLNKEETKQYFEKLAKEKGK